MRKLLRNFCAVFGLIIGAWPVIAPGATSLTDTIELLPGPDAYSPQQMALNHSTHRLYVMGAAASGFQDLAVKVIDTSNGSLVGNIDLGRQPSSFGAFDRFTPYGIAVDESTTTGGNKVYLVGALGNFFYLRTIENDAVVAGADVALTGQPYPLVGISAVAVNSATHKVYYVNTNGTLTVINGPAHAVVTSYGTSVGTGPHLFVVNPNANKIFLFGRSGAVIIDGATDSASPITVPSQFNPTVGVYNPVNGRIVAFGSSTQSNTTGLYVFDGASGASAGSRTSNVPLELRGLTVNPASNIIYGAVPFIQTQPGGIFAFDGNDLSDKGSFTTNAAVLTFDLGRLLFLDYDYSETYSETRNRVGLLDLSNGSISKTTLAYRPYQTAVNTQTNRVYVLDELNADLVVLNGADHSIIARAQVPPANTGSYYAKSIVRRGLAVSEALNRIYLPRLDQISDDGTKTFFLDVIDGTTYQTLQSIPLATGFFSTNGFIVVDDQRHRVYLTGQDASFNPKLFVINADTNSVSTSLPTFNSVTGLAVNPATGKIYVSGRPNGGKVEIFDGSTFASRGLVSAGAVPGPMAVNRQTNKIYVANVGAGSVDNSVTVINGATDQTETTFSNTSQNNGDAVSDVAVDPITNRIFVADNSNGFDATGRITIFSGANNTFQQQIEVGRYPIGLTFNTASKELFAPNNEDGTVSVIGSGVPAGPLAPPNGGLSATVFRINGSSNPTGNLADTALHFSAQQSGTPGGLNVRVQLNSVPNNDLNDWVDLPNGSKGYMTVDAETQQYVLTSTNYPSANGVYFRVLATAPGYPASKSNIIGPLNLSYNKTHLGPTKLFMATNGPGQEMRFRANVGVDQPTQTISIQSTVTPDDDSSWAALADGNNGGMHPFADPLWYFLDTTKYPAGAAVYFRARLTSALSGTVDSYSNIIGVKDVITGQQPTVEVQPPPPQPGSQSGLDADHPIIVAIGSFQVGAIGHSPENKAIRKLGVIYDGSTILTRDGIEAFTDQYTTTVPGDHVIRAFAIDERGIAGYAAPVYIRIKPEGGKVFNMVNSGDWNNAANWLDENGLSGVPGLGDFAVIGNSVTASISQAISAFSVALKGGEISGAGGSLKINQHFSLTGGTLRNINLTINTAATMVLSGDDDVRISGNVTNAGTVKMTGRGGIVPVPAAARTSLQRGSNPDGLFDGVGAFFKNIGDWVVQRLSRPPHPAPNTPPPRKPERPIAVAKFEGSGRFIAPNGASIIGENSSGIIGENSSGIIGENSSGLISQDGGGVISNDGNSLIGNDGASLIANDGASRPGLTEVTQGGAAGFVQTAGETDLSGLQIVGSVLLNGGTLKGSGVILGSLTNNGGFISPGHSPGTITVSGDFEQGANGALIVERGGAASGQYDQLQVSGAASLGGKLIVHTINGYVPNAADTFSPLSYGSVAGAFTSVSGNTSLAFNADGALAQLNPAVVVPPDSALRNISTRARIETGDNVMIGGFIINGSTSKRVIIRAIGPSLPVGGTLADPILELHQGDGTVVTNDNWRSDQEQEIIATQLAPTNNLEAAIIATLPPGGHTAIVRGKNGGSGIGLVEVYELDSSATAVFANISTRARVQTGDNVMIGGMIVGGTEPATVVIRAVGPSLAAAGVGGVLADPMLEIHDGNGNVFFNDDWIETQEAALRAIDFEPGDTHESAMMIDLVPGAYTAIVRGKNNGSGVALIEAYKIR